MSAINDLIAQIEDEGLRQRIDAEVKRLLKQKKFGLVFEEHQPEGLNEGPIYPCLQVMDEVKHSPDNALWHALIEADNYYALQLLAYLYSGMVDCIYIDPPYNTGARDWKYNNDYVDSADQYRHSKWLSMMKRRLLLAKKLLNPKDSVLIVTIDEKEYLHLGCLLEELFPEARMQMVTIVTNPFGQERNQQLARCEEYAFYLFFGEAAPCPQLDDLLNNRQQNEDEFSVGVVARHGVTVPTEHVRWERLLRGGADALRKNNPNLFYPVFVDIKNYRIQGVGDPIDKDVSIEEILVPEGCIAAWPIKTNGVEGRWRCSAEYFRDLVKKGYARVGEYDKKLNRYSILYLSKATMQRIENGEIEVIGRDSQNAVVLNKVASKQQLFSVKTVWNRPQHRAGEWGTRYIRNMLINRTFPYPKSLYAVKDSLKIIVANKPNALIVDFFAGSGTTLHAVNLLNAEDGGHRRCIMVTNNEVSEQEAKTLTKQGFKPGDDEWERLGIARYVNWPRTVCSIEGHDVNGQPLKGEYLGTDHRQMKDGFPANCIFFKLNFLDKTQVALGRQFRELLPLLWMKAGATGGCPQLSNDTVPQMLILPENKFAVLTDEKAFSEFMESVNEHDDIRMVYLVTDSDSMYREMSRCFPKRQTCQLYRDYLDNFRINVTR